jgi:nickel transport protein
MRRSPLPVLLGTAALVFAPALVRAHAIQTDINLLDGSGVPHSHGKAAAAGSRLQLASAFSTGEPARDAAVRLLPGPGGRPVELGRTDTNGRLAFVLPAQAGGNGEIQVDAGAGHRDWIELSEIGNAGHQTSQQGPRNWAGLGASLLSMAPITALGLLGGLARLRRPRG